MTEQATLPPTAQDQSTDQLNKALASLYVRREQRFYHVDRPTEPLSRRDVEQTFLHQSKKFAPGLPITPEMMKRVFSVCIDIKHTDATRSIQVWGGSITCQPGNANRIILNSTGSVIINSWRVPNYRTIGITDAGFGPFAAFLDWLFPKPNEQARVLDWLAWCLQNEDKKPAWAILLYSREKGTGKSTFCDLARCLFGAANTATQNNVDLLTSRFNTLPLTNRLVISEELNLRPESNQSNALKTYITDKWIAAERKGREAEQLPLVSCFLFTTNHLPTWLEAGERRYYLIDTGHDGFASGPRAAEFSSLVGAVAEAMQDSSHIARIYNMLMQRKLTADFNAQSLNAALHATDLMKRVQSASRQTNLDQLQEFLDRAARKVMTQAEVKDYIVREFKVSGNTTRHLMIELGWTQYNVKWGGRDYAQVIWACPGYTVAGGNIYGPNSSIEAVCDHLALESTE